MKSLNRLNPERQQHGAALILLVFVLAIAMTTYLIKTFNSDRLKVDQEQRVMQNLADAKEALIAWAVSNSDHFGQLPYPDRRETTPPPNYDGFSDCGGDIVNDKTFLIGQLPIYGQSAPCVLPRKGLGVNALSWQGHRLWYAVSINLVHNHVPSFDPIINPSIVNSPANPWLRVIDQNGVLISDRVAAVIIAPGEALAGQDRAGVATVDNFLDSFQKGGSTYSNQDYNSADEDFIIAASLSQVDDNDPSITKPYLFNDKLVYITIDELMASLEKRVGEEVSHALKTYKATNGYYPYAAHLGTSLSYVSDGNLQKGFLPLFQSCDLNIATQSFSCRQPIFDTVLSGITNIKFVLSSPLYISSSGSCTNTSTECDCTGTGSCTASSFTFECGTDDAKKICALTGSLGVSAQLEVQGGYLVAANNSCTVTPSSPTINGCPSNASAACDVSADGFVAAHQNSDAPLTLSDWFVVNQWQNHVYYEMTRPDSQSITVGGANTAEAVIVTVGHEIGTAPFAISKGAAQVRPSCNDLSDYLDSTENANTDSVYDATYKQRSPNYNDQIFVVEP